MQEAPYSDGQGSVKGLLSRYVLRAVKWPGGSADHHYGGPMTRKINYEDDIFSLALQVRCLQDILKLEIDPEFFRERILGDISWADLMIAKVYQSLVASSLFVKRQEHLREIQKLKRAFIDAIDGLLTRRVPFAQYVADSADRLRAIREAHEKDIVDIRELLAGRGQGAPEEEQVVSAEELKFLMTTAPDEES